jgi:hypothetical protein
MSASMTCPRGHSVGTDDVFCSCCGLPLVDGPGGGPPYTPYQPPYPPCLGHPPQPRTTNGLAIASLVLAIVWIWGLGSLLALIFGVIAKHQIEDSWGGQRGRGLAIAGITLGLVGALGALFLIVGLAVATSHSAQRLNPLP